jgi:formiminoglutamate deiminase
VSRLWCEWAWLGGATAERGVLIDLAGERIGEVSTGCDPPPSDTTVLAGLTIPGLANAHSHAFQRALRGRTHSGPGSFWTWREQMYELSEALDPDAYRALARATFAEMALAGITLVGEFHYLHHAPGGAPYADPNEMGRGLLDAAAGAGVRITLLDTCYLHGGMGLEPEPAQRRFCDADADAWASRAAALSPAPTARIGAAVHSVRAVDPQAIATVASWAAQRESPLHAHVSEQPAENEACLAAYRTTPTQVLGSAGALSSRFTAVHATHLLDRDFELLAQARARACLCPTTERDLADGVGPGHRLREGGVGLALGSDSHAMIDHFEEARAVELDERLATGIRGRHTATDLLGAATAGGYASLGWPEGGRIEVGAPADLTTVAMDSVRLAGTTRENAVQAVVFCAGAEDVAHVMVAGRTVVQDGIHVDLDVAGALRDAVGALRR